MAVSDPDSSHFGQSWAQEEVIEAFKPTDETVSTVQSWLASQGIEDVTHTDNKQWLAFDVLAKDAEALFKTKYFEAAVGNSGVEVSCESYMLPVELQRHIDFVKP